MKIIYLHIKYILRELTVISGQSWKNQPLLTRIFQQPVENTADNPAFPTKSPLFSHVTVEKSVEKVDKSVKTGFLRFVIPFYIGLFLLNKMIRMVFFIVFGGSVWYNGFIA